MGTVVQFPARMIRRQFSDEMLGRLVRLAARTPGAQPLWFGADERGAEVCRFASGLQVGWDRRGRLVLTDMVSGYVDDGPFRDLDEVCRLINYLAA